MPINKNQQVRLRILDDCLSNFMKWFTMDQLLDKVNDHLVQEMGEEPVSKRTVYTDLKTLQNPDIFNAEIEKRKSDRKVYYRSVSYTHLRAHETDSYLVCRL